MLSAFLLAALLQGPFTQSSVTQATIGDGGSVALTLQNATVHRQLDAVGGLELAVDPHGSATVYVQCAGTAPALSVRHRGQTDTFIPPVITFPEGPPAVWITTARQGRAALAKRLSGMRGPTSVLVVTPKEVPTWFGALRFAPMIMIGASTWAELTDLQRAAIARSAASGAILVVSAGEGAVSADTLAGLIDVQLGPLMRVGPAMLTAVNGASTRRGVQTPTPRVIADGSPLVARAAYGLGEVRVVGARLVEIGTGPVGEAVFGPAPDRLGPILDWANAQAALGEQRDSPFAPWIWYALLALIGLAILSRWAPRTAAVGALVWGVGAIALPPTRGALSVEGGRFIAIPAGSEHLIVGTVDMTLGRGGVHRLRGGPAASLDDARPGGACRVARGEGAMWIVEGAPNTRRRLTIFGFAANVADGTPVDAPPPGPGRLERLAQGVTSAVLRADIATDEAWRFVPAPEPLVKPITLAAAPDP